MRQCWLEHDKCSANCPCNEECPDGCPEPYDGHPCESWFCQGELPVICAAENDPIREECGDRYSYIQEECLAQGCCWTEFYDPYGNVPWCHHPKLHTLPSL